MTRKQKRLSVIGIIGAVLFTAVLMVMFALNDEIVFFYEPSAVVEDGKAQNGEYFRLGGLVKEGSIEKNGNQVHFVVTDLANDVPVVYQGLLPDLFRENQGVVTEGRLGKDGVFTADTVLAKHDENYMPKEVADALKKRGVWEADGNSAKTGEAASPGEAKQ